MRQLFSTGCVDRFASVRLVGDSPTRRYIGSVTVLAYLGRARQDDELATATLCGYGQGVDLVF